MDGSNPYLTAYRQKQQAPQQAQPQQQGGGGLFGLLQTVGKSLGSDFSRVGQGTANVIGQLTGQTDAARNANSQTQQLTNTTIKNLGNKLKTTTDPVVRQRLQAGIAKQSAIGQGIAANTQNNENTIVEQNDPLKGAAAVAGIGTDVLSGGTGAGILKGGLKAAIGNGLKQGALYGGVQGALQPIKDTGQINPEDIAGSTVAGAGQGAISGAVLGGAGKIANGLLRKVIGNKSVPTAPVVGTADQTAITAAKQANGLKSPLVSSAAAAKKYSTNLLANKLNIKAGDAQKYNAVNTIQSLQDKYGLTPIQASQLHPIITGGEGASTESLNNALEGVGSVKFADFGDTMTKELKDPEFLAANGLSKSQTKNFVDTINKYHDTLNPANPAPLAGKGSPQYKIDTGVNAKLAMDTAKDLERKGYNNVASGSDAKNATGDMQLKMADFIKRRIYNSPGGQEALNAAKTETASQLDNIAQQSGNRKLSSVANDFRNAKTFEDYRGVSAPFVNAKKLADITENRNLENVGSGQGSNGLFATMVKEGSRVASPPVGKLLSKFANKITPPDLGTPVPSASAAVADSFKAPGLLARIQNAGGVGAATNIAAERNAPSPDAINNLNPLASSISNVVPTDNVSPDTSTGASSTDQTSGIFSNPKVIEALLLDDISKTGGKNTSTLLSLYNAFKPSATSASTGKVTAQQAGLAQGGVESLGQLSNLLQSDPGVLTRTAIPGQNLPLVGGLVQNAAGTGSYENTANNIIDSLARLRTGAAMSNSEKAFYQNMLPRAGDSQETINTKLQTLQQAFQPFIQNNS